MRLGGLALLLLQPLSSPAPPLTPGWLHHHGIEVLLLLVLAGVSLGSWRLVYRRGRALGRLQELVEQTADLVFRSASDGTIVWIACARLAGEGLGAEQLRGTPLRALFASEDQLRLQSRLAEVAAGEQGAIELRLVCPNGPARWLSVWIRPLRDQRGRLLGYSGHGRDIDAEMQAREAKASSERRFELMMENAAIGMALVAPEGKLLRVNPALCRMLGRDKDVLLHCTWQEITHPDDLTIDLKLCAAAAGWRDQQLPPAQALSPPGWPGDLG